MIGETQKWIDGQWVTISVTSQGKDNTPTSRVGDVQQFKNGQWVTINKTEQNIKYANAQTEQHLNEYQATQESGMTGFWNRRNNSLGRGVTQPALVNETPEYTQERQSQEQYQKQQRGKSAGQHLKDISEHMTFGASKLLSDVTQSIHYQTVGKKKIEDINEEVDRKRKELLKILNERTDLTAEEKARFMKIINDNSQYVLASDIYDFANKNELQIAGESLGALADILTLGTASAGLKMALKTGGVKPLMKFIFSKQGGKFIAAQSIRGAVQFGAGGAGMSLAEGETRPKEIGKQALTTSAVGAVAHPIFTIGGGYIGKLLSKFKVSRLLSKELGKLTEEESKTVDAYLARGLKAEDAIKDVRLNRELKGEIAKAPPKTEAPKVKPVTPKPTPKPLQEGGKTPSKIGKSIEAKAIEQKLTKGFSEVAGYDKITIKEQSEWASGIVNKNIDEARLMIRGEVALPEGKKGVALITAMEDYIKKNPNSKIAYELANSPLVSETSEAGQILRLAAEREQDSVASKIADIKKAWADKAKVKKSGVLGELMSSTKKVNISKAEQSWDNFLNSIKC